MQSTTESAPSGRRFWLINAVIIGFLLLQFATAFRLTCPPDFLAPLSFMKVACDPALFPFMSYPMYSGSLDEGASVMQYKMYGVQEDGTEVLIDYDALGVTFFQLFYAQEEVVNENNTDDIVAYAKLYEERYDVDFESVRLENAPILITSEGNVPGEVDIVADVALGDEE